jgi:shikimate kinase
MSLLGKHSNIILVGFMGSGKTSVGLELSIKTNMDFIDTDFQLTELFGMSISEYFTAHNEEEFRMEEQKIITEVCKRMNQVVGTGGGAFLDQQSRTTMLNSGTVIWLKASEQSIISRIESDTGTIRPLLTTGNLKDNISTLLSERQKIYNEAHINVETDNLSPVEISDIILTKMK